VGQWLLYVPRDLILQSSTFCPHSVFMCFVWIWEQTAIISVCSFNWMGFIPEPECVYCAVRTECLNMIQVKVCLQRVKQPSTWFYSTVGVVQFTNQLIAQCLASVRMPDLSSTLRHSGLGGVSIRSWTSSTAWEQSSGRPASVVFRVSLHFCFQRFSCRPVWNMIWTRLCYIVARNVSMSALRYCESYK